MAGFVWAKQKTSLGTIAILSEDEIIVRGDPEEGTKNSEIRRVPMIAEMRQLLEKLRRERPDEPATARVMRVTQCELAMEQRGKESGHCSFDPSRLAPFVCDAVH